MGRPTVRMSPPPMPNEGDDLSEDQGNPPFVIHEGESADGARTKHTPESRRVAAIVPRSRVVSAFLPSTMLEVSSPARRS